LELALPIEPMLGTVGLAPAAGEVRSSLVPDTFGGNMDTPEMRAGATCFLNVNVEGAMFSVGDGHYRQGEGESCGTAVEGAMNVVLIVDLLKTPGPAWPRIENLDKLDAYQLLSQVSEVPLANVVDANYSVVTKVPKRLLPAADVYSGIHRHLRGLAATL
jgi:acetamidase/formamidase